MVRSDISAPVIQTRSAGSAVLTHRPSRPRGETSEGHEAGR